VPADFAWTCGLGMIIRVLRPYLWSVRTPYAPDNSPGCNLVGSSNEGRAEIRVSV